MVVKEERKPLQENLVLLPLHGEEGRRVQRLRRDTHAAARQCLEETNASSPMRAAAACHSSRVPARIRAA